MLNADWAERVALGLLFFNQQSAIENHQSPTFSIQHSAFSNSCILSA
jgi:hypothetical protein